MIVIQNCLSVNALEGTSWYNILLLLPGLLFSVLYQIFSRRTHGENVNHTLTISAADILNNSLAAGLLLVQFVKYFNLNKLNALHSKKVESTVKSDQGSQQEQTRRSVLQALDLTVESQEQDKQRLKQLTINAMFNKEKALRGSRYFQSLKESVVARNSDFRSITSSKMSTQDQNEWQSSVIQSGRISEVLASDVVEKRVPLK